MELESARLVFWNSDFACLSGKVSFCACVDSALTSQRRKHHNTDMHKGILERPQEIV